MVKPNGKTHYIRNGIWFKRIETMNKKELFDEVKKLEEQAKTDKRNFNYKESELNGRVFDLKTHIANLEFSLNLVIKGLTEKAKQEERRFGEEQWD